MIAAACVLVPFLAAAALAVLPAGWRAHANRLAAAATFALTACLPWAPAPRGGWLLADGLAVQLAVLTGFLGLTAAWSDPGDAGARAEADAGGDRPAGTRPRLHRALFQAALGCVLLAALSDDAGATWAALGAAHVIGAFAAGSAGTPEAARAARRGLVAVWAGAAPALFGTVALYLAVLPVLGPAATSWSGLAEAAPGVSGAMLTWAAAFLFVGYGGWAALAPLHGRTPGPRAGEAAPVAAFVSGAVPAAALAVLLRLRGVLASNPDAVPPGPPLLALGLASLLLAGFGLRRRRDAAGVLGLYAVGQRGLVCLGFGLGTPAATFGALLHLAAHTLAGAVVWRCAGADARVGAVCGRTAAHGPGAGADVRTGAVYGHTAAYGPGAGTAARAGQERRRADGGGDGGGLDPSPPAPSRPAPPRRAWGVPFAAGVAALAGLPPFGVFAGGYLILTEAARVAPWLLLPAGAGLVAGAWALLARLSGPWPGGAARDAAPRDADAAEGEAPPARDDGASSRAAPVGVWLNLAAALALGALLPAPVAAWLRAAAEALP